MDITQCDKESIDQIGDREPFHLVDSWQDVFIAARVRCGCFCFWSDKCMCNCVFLLFNFDQFTVQSPGLVVNTFVYLTIILNFQLSNSWTSFDPKKMRSTCHSRIGHFGNSVVGQQNIPIPSCQIAVNELYTNSNKTQLMSNYITFRRSYLVSSYSFLYQPSNPFHGQSERTEK